MRVCWSQTEGKQSWREKIAPFLKDGVKVRCEIVQEGNSSTVTGSVWFDNGFPRVGSSWIGVGSGPTEELHFIEFPTIPAWTGAFAIHAPDIKKSYYLEGSLYFAVDSIIGLTPEELELKHERLEIKIL